MTLKYPASAGGVDSDYVSFAPFQWRSNQRNDRANASAPVASDGAQSVILYMPNDTPGIRNTNNWGEESFLGPLGDLRKRGGELLGGIAYDGFSALTLSK